MEPKYLTANQVRARFGGISDMTLWRWLKDEQLGFPRPLLINRRRFFRLDRIEAFEASASPMASDAQRISPDDPVSVALRLAVDRAGRAGIDRRVLHTLVDDVLAARGVEGVAE